MKTAVTLALLILLASALQLEESHEQSRPASNTAANQPHPTSPQGNTPAYNPNQPRQTFPPGTPNNNGPHPNQPNGNNAARKPSTASFNRVGYESQPGTPFGQEKDRKRTCFQTPCFAPSAPCQFPKKWQIVFYIVPTVTGRKARFIGYECK